MESEQATSIYQLVHSTNLSNDFEGFVEDVLRNVAEDLESSNASFWILDEEDQKFFCMRSYDKTTDTFSRGQIISKKLHEPFYNILIQHEVINIPNIHSDRTHDSSIHKFLSRSTQSWMSRLDYLDGKLFGFIRLDSSFERVWDDRSHEKLVLAMALINQSYYANHYELSNPNKLQKNSMSIEYLENLKQKMSEYAFFTAHNIRHPLTNLFSLLDMLKELDDDEKRRKELLQLINIEAIKLDEVIRVMIVKLELE